MKHETDKYIPRFVGPVGIELLQQRGHYVVLDFETNNKLNGLAISPDNHIVLACWTVVENGKETRKHKFADEYGLQELVDDVQRADFIVAHNAKFELQWLSRCGLDLREVLVYDTMVSEWVLQGNRKTQYSLDAMASRYVRAVKENLVSTLIKKKIDPADIPRSWLLQYCEIDVDLCHQIFKKQKPLIDESNTWHLVLARNLMIPVLASIEMEGLTLDHERVKKEHERLLGILDETGKQLDEITGGINLNSPKQLTKFLYESIGFAPAVDNGGRAITTPTGLPSANADAISRLVPTTNPQRAFLKLYGEYNKANTLLSKNLEFFRLVCEEHGCRLYGQLNQCRAANHRLASSGIKQKFKQLKKEIAAQLQNLPRQYKSLFTTDDPDYVVTEYDGSQIEFRTAAELGHDPVAEADIVNGVDIHSFTRDVMNAAYKKHRLPHVIDRQGAKPRTFAPLYGAFGKDKAEQEYAVAFRKKYNGIYEEQTRWTLIVADEKKLTTPYGLTFYWPNAIMQRSGRVNYMTEIFNLPISGFATGEIIPIALVHFWYRIRETRCRPFNTVHDSLVVLNHKDEQHYVTEIAKTAMTYDVYKFLDEVYDYQFRVPLGFGCKTGTHWGEADHEFKWDVWPDGNERLQVEVDKELQLIYDTRKGDKLLGAADAEAIILGGRDR